MQKILPFDKKPIVKTYPYFANYLGSIKANGYEIENILEHNFMFLNYIPFTGQVNFQHKASLRNSLKFHQYDVGSIDIIDFVKRNINKNNYIEIVLNDNYFETKQKLGSHNWLLYGYDDDKKTVEIIGYIIEGNCGNYESLTITFSELEKSVVRTLTKRQKKRISTNLIFNIPKNYELPKETKYGFLKKANFRLISLNVFKLLIAHNFIFSYFKLHPYKRSFLDLRDLRIIYEQSMVFRNVLLKKHPNGFESDLETLIELSESILNEAGIYLYNVNNKKRTEIVSSINKKIYNIYIIEKKLFKYIYK